MACFGNIASKAILSKCETEFMGVSFMNNLYLHTTFFRVVDLKGGVLKIYHISKINSFPFR